jgi:hypothetical protein
VDIFIPTTGIIKTTGGLSVFGSLRVTPFIAKVASEWTSYRGGALKEAGRLEKVGAVPQVVNEGNSVSIQALITDTDTQNKFQAHVLRGFALRIDETHGQIHEIVACDRAGDDGPGTIKLYKRGKIPVSSLIDDEAARILKQYEIVVAKGSYRDSNSTSTAWSNPATGTNSASRGDGDDTPGYQPELDTLSAFIREFKIAIVELGAANENSDLSPEEVIEQASRIAMQRVKQTNASDWSGGNGDDDESLNPNGPGAAAANAFRSTGDTIQQMASGFEIAKRVFCMNDLDAGLLGKLSDRGRVGVAGASDALLTRDDGGELKKIEDGRAGELSFSKILSEPGDPQLEKRISEGNATGTRRSLDFDAFRGYSVAPFEGSYSPGCLSDPLSDLTKRIDRVHRGGGSDITKLLH